MFTTSRRWQGAGTRRQFLDERAAGIAAGGLASGLEPFGQSIARDGGIGAGRDSKLDICGTRIKYSAGTIIGWDWL